MNYVVDTFEDINNPSRFPYIRDPEVVADYICDNFSDSRLLIYGEGLHTSEFLSYIRDRIDIGGVISQKYKYSSFVGFNFTDIEIIDEDDVRWRIFDYIVLLGRWEQKNIIELASRIGISESRMLVPYKNKTIYMETLSRHTEKNRLKMSKHKPNLVLVIASDRKDFITIAARHLCQEFNLIKIYIDGGVIYCDDNKYFSQVVTLSGDIEHLHDLLDTDKAPEIVVYWLSSQYEYCEAMYSRSLFGSRVKFVLATSDLFFSGLYRLDTKTLGKCIDMSGELSVFNADCENRLLQQSDAVITNFTGEFKTNSLEKLNKNVLFSYYFLDSIYFVFKEKILSENISVCFIGSIEFIKNESENPVRGSSRFDVIFHQMLSQGININIYNPRLLEHDSGGEYIKLKEKYNQLFEWHGFVPSSILPQHIADYDFGLVIANVVFDVEKVYSVQFNSLFQARVISYLGAGLPIIVSREYTLIADFVEKNKLGIVVSRDDIVNLKSIISSVDYRSLKEAVKIFQVDYSENKHYLEISDFMTDLLGQKDNVK